MTAQQERYAYYRAQGRCPYCREHRPLVEWHAYCAECMEYFRLKQQELHRKRFERGECVRCCSPLAEGNSLHLCAKCRNRNAENAARIHRERKENQCCVRCGKPLDERDRHKDGRYMRMCFQCRILEAEWRAKKKEAANEDV